MLSDKSYRMVGIGIGTVIVCRSRNRIIIQRDSKLLGRAIWPVFEVAVGSVDQPIVTVKPTLEGPIVALLPHIPFPGHICSVPGLPKNLRQRHRTAIQ